MSGNGSTDDLLPGRVWPSVPVSHPPVVALPHPNRWPTSVIFAASLIKLFLGPLAIVFAGMALLVDADLAEAGGGFWAGAVATAAGALGTCIRHPTRLPVGFVGWTGLSLGASVLLIVLSGTGLAHDVIANRKIWPPALAANAILLTIGTLDCLASIFALAAQFGAGRHHLVVNSDDRRNRRLVQWLHSQRRVLQPIFNQALQKPIQFSQHPQLYTLDSRTPRVNAPPKTRR